MKPASKKIEPSHELATRKAISFFFLIAILIFALDHLFKLILVKKGCFLFMCLKMVTNTGAAFSIFAGMPWARILLIVIGIIVLIVVAYFYFKHHKNTLLKVSLALIFAGTISNLLDRIFLKYVIDYFSFSFWPTFSTFNLADVSNLAGVIILIIFLLKRNSS
jgi:signal peptidase II